MSYDADVLIAGGGLVGGTLALALTSAGLDVILIDPAPEAGGAGFDGRSSALALTSQRLLKALGVWARLADDAQPILQIKVTDGRAGEAPSPFALEFDHAEIEEGPMGYMAENRHLRFAIASTVAESPVRAIAAGVTAQSTDGAGVSANLADGRRLRGRVLIGCDGRDSGTARRAGIRHVGWRYLQSALICAVRHERPHGGVAHQFFMPEGPLAILPLTGNRSSIVWSQPHAQAARVMALDEAGYLAALRPRFGGFLGEIALEGERYTYPLSLSLAQHFVAPRVALAGDAAHVVHPIAGQGLNAGLKDVAALAQVLAEARRRGEDVGAPDVLARYQTWRRFDVTALAVATDAFNRLFSNDNPLLRFGRDIGMGLVNALPGARRGAIREAAGLTGDLPRLLQGRPL
ncbi:FAD-dependent monooxygenase [Roseitranquillus sediminis]|uniref:FAD-dependent monooxygenase n=1 Tax=Roseitranquillus sediminis TaxID=2809051 RepID=UPI001D0C1FE5|nr:FAD-dependent monooxygenase [Roseitranquillus sediminis]MBM9593711.1 FAD-dependent monooxygenase [Roseitranquillus sediminis]